MRCPCYSYGYESAITVLTGPSLCRVTSCEVLNSGSTSSLQFRWPIHGPSRQCRTTKWMRAPYCNAIFLIDFTRRVWLGGLDPALTTSSTHNVGERASPRSYKSYKRSWAWCKVAQDRTFGGLHILEGSTNRAWVKLEVLLIDRFRPSGATSPLRYVFRISYTSRLRE
jgi:hypothetical protein